MNLKITSLGFIVSGGGNHQFQIEMEAELVGRDGVVIWRSDSGTWPHNDQLPARPFESYRNNHEQFRQDYRASCRWVCDQLIEELKWQVEPGE
jgi:hypothetical protein